VNALLIVGLVVLLGVVFFINKSQKAQKK